jgi:hypothetical protein
MEHGIETMIIGGGEKKSSLTLEGSSIISDAMVGEEIEITLKVKLVKDELKDEIGNTDAKEGKRCQEFEVIEKNGDDAGDGDGESKSETVGETVRKELGIKKTGSL